MCRVLQQGRFYYKKLRFLPVLGLDWESLVTFHQTSRKSSLLSVCPFETKGTVNFLIRFFSIDKDKTALRQGGWGRRNMFEKA